MTEVEKMRALLAEARGVIDEGLDRSVPSVIQRIDAALAEPVSDDFKRERDEARAEVERLRSLKPIGTYSLDWNHEQERMTVARAAYQRGAEAMREAAASCVGSDTALLQTYRSVLEGRIRDLPVPEDKP